MTSLLFESSSSKSCLILAKHGKAVDSFDLEGGSGLSQKIFSLLEDLLKRGAFSWKELDYIACGTGPGSFTGIRISAAIAQTLSFAKGLPLISFSSLVAFTPKNEGAFFTALDAKSFGIYLLKGERKREGVTFSYPHQIIRWEDCSQLLSSADPLFSADAQDIQKKFDEKGIPYTCLDAKPSPEFLASFCQKKYEQRELSSIPLELSYLRDT